jgi:hypothetical protein
MKNLLFIMTISATFFLSACLFSDQEIVPMEQANFQKDDLLSPPPMQQNFKAHLTGSEEVPANSSIATGQSIFQFSMDGGVLHYKLIVANINDVRFSHIHLAPSGVNGPVVAFLYGGPTIPGTTNGILAEGSITSADLRGPLEGESLDVLRERMESGDLYVNVHTDAFPGGEIRGQIH